MLLVLKYYDVINMTDVFDVNRAYFSKQRMSMVLNI